MNTKEKIEVMQAYLNGAMIEKKLAITIKAKWEHCELEPAWNWGCYDYRIKKEMKYRPLKDSELRTLKGKWLKSKKTNNFYFVSAIEDKEVTVGIMPCSPKCLLEEFTYEDGTPIGALEEQ